MRSMSGRAPAHTSCLGKLPFRFIGKVRDVPLGAGRFGLDEYTQHLIDFLAAMGRGPTTSPSASPVCGRWRQWL